jgi:preprotein translocase subunit SecF
VNVASAIETYRGHTVPHLRIIELRNRWFAASGVLIALSLIGLLFVRLNLSIDFEGGTQLSYPLRADVTAEDVSSLLAERGHDGAEVQIVNGNTVSVRTAALTADEREPLLAALADQAGVARDDVSDEVIGPTWGAEISRKALIGLAVVLAAISLYIALRFEPKMALGAMVALVHDVVITGGTYALVGREVTPETVIAILTILGFSLYDTVVIYDKIKENTEAPTLLTRHGYAGVVNLSLNQVLMRSVNTSLVVLLPILSLLFFGGDTLKDFAFAMFVGVAIGAYSSIFIAAPVLVILKEREPRYRDLEVRREARELRTAAKAERAESAGTTVASVSDAAATKVVARTGSAGRPRPQSKSKSKRQRAKRKRR